MTGGKAKFKICTTLNAGKKPRKFSFYPNTYHQFCNGQSAKPLSKFSNDAINFIAQFSQLKTSINFLL